MPRTRFVCVSDTHGYTPSEGGFKLPAGDVLIHAGDLTNQGSVAEIQRTIDWITKADFEVKIIVAGNHDIRLDPVYCSNNQDAEESRRCREAIASASSSIVFLAHESAFIRLTRPEGPRTAFKVFGSPCSPRMSETWAAFTYEAARDEDGATGLWSKIPGDADVVVTHTPPHSHLDCRTGGPTGCKALCQTLRLVRPCLAVCGHVHESRGAERVSWSEGDVERCDLPLAGNKKQSLVDLTGKKGRRLDNRAAGSQDLDTLSAAVSAGQRSETCIVNAAVLASSWPYRGGKKFNAPVVVDLELPGMP